MKDFSNYYEYLKALCMIKGKRPSAVCADVGINKSTVTKWHNPETDITMFQARRLAPYLGVTIDELAARDGETLDWILAIPDCNTRAIAKLLWPDEPHALAADYVADIRQYADFLLLRSKQPTD